MSSNFLISRAQLKKTSKSDYHIEAHVDGIIAVLQVTDEKLEEIKAETQKEKNNDISPKHYHARLA